MITTSEQYKKSIYAPARTCKAIIRFEMLDVEAFNDNTKTASSEESISRLFQITNKVRKKDLKIATFEKDYFKLDGSFSMPPKADEGEFEIGWVSSVVSDENNTFTPYQVLEFTFSEEHSSAGITIYFDILANEYASDFEIHVFDSNNEIVQHQDVVNNTDARYIFFSQLSNYKKITITLKKWCKPFRRAKVVEVDFGVIKEYGDDHLIDLRILQELNPTSSTLPSDELRFVVDNSNREFNVLNPKGIYEYLQEGQEVFVDIGVTLENGTIEYVPTGKFYLKDWQSDEGSLTTTFTARDVLDALSSDEVENVLERDISLYDLALEVLEASNIEDFSLSNNLSLIRTKGLYNKMSYRNLLQLIAIAGMSVAYSDNVGRLHMKQLISASAVIDSVNVTNEIELSDKDQIINKIIEPSMNIATFEANRFKLDGSFNIPVEDMSSYEVGWISNDLSDPSGQFQTPVAVEIVLSREHASINFEVIFDKLTNEYASEFDLKVYDFNNEIKFVETIYNSKSKFFYENNQLENCRKIELVIKKWSKPNRRARIIEIGFDLPVDNLTFDNIYIEPQIEIQRPVKTIEITYFPTDLENNETFVLNNHQVKDGIVLKLENSLINTEQDARNVAQWLLREHTKVATFKVDWRQNPALTLGDKVSIENGYGLNNIANITKQEIEYQGYLKGKTEAKGGI